MYADVVVAERRVRRRLESRATPCQNAGDCYGRLSKNPKESGKSIEREVRLGQASGEQVEVVSGVQLGDVVVTDADIM